jgi:hypothetical protein
VNARPPPQKRGTPVSPPPPLPAKPEPLPDQSEFFRSEMLGVLYRLGTYCNTAAEFLDVGDDVTAANIIRRMCTCTDALRDFIKMLLVYQHEREARQERDNG